MNVYERVCRLAHALGMEPTEKATLEPSRVTGRKAWWLTGCIGGDAAIPQTGHAHTVHEALDAAEAWLAPELVALEQRNKP